MSSPANIDNPEQARNAIEAWRVGPQKAQIRQLNNAIQSIELNQMYFEQKANEKAALRMEKCLELLRERLNEIVQE